MSSAANPASLDLSTEELLTIGGDSRSLIGSNGLTQYGTCSFPSQAVPFGSCTASSPIQRVYDAAVAMHALLRNAHAQGELKQQIRRSYQQINAAIHHYLNIAKQDVCITLTPSGTDAEFIVMALALGDRSRPLCNIVVGPQEIGSGSAAAAAGLYFDSVLPHGLSQTKDDPVAPGIAKLVHVETIPLRNTDGRVLEPEDLDAATEELVHQALAKHERVLIHLVAHSKTGVHAPSISMVRKLQHKYPGDIMVVVDAAQGRFSRQGLLSVLSDGFLVLITGSKFYGGPPFSGVLMVPGSYDHIVRTLPPLPVEFGNYFSRWDFPKEWTNIISELPYDYNLGLLIRWAAAVEAMRAYYSVPGLTRFAILRRFEGVVPREYAKFPWFELDKVNPVQFPAGEERLLESKTTVFPFRMRMPTSSGEPRFLLNAELKRVFEWLNEDISRFAVNDSIATRRSLALKFHLGQPVFKGDAKHPAVLRIALGAALVTEVGMNRSYGAALDDRLNWLDDQVRMVLAKLDWIYQHHEMLTLDNEVPRR